jgi:molybdopterin-guanine dinucleotide biosynthesis protein A
MKLSVVVQAGGESRRMGRNKALVPFLGVPMIQRVCDRMAGCGNERIVTANHPRDLAFLDLPCFPDLVPDRGALGGLYTALWHSSHPLVAVVACDMPFANLALLRFACDQIGSADVAIPESAGGLEPLHAVYRRETCLPAIRAALDIGKWRVDAWFGQVQIRVLERSDYAHLDPRELTFVNVNTPEELAQAEAWALIE